MRQEREVSFQNRYGIEVNRYIEKYNITDAKTKEALEEFPILCYLLGKVTQQPQGKDSRPDGIERQVFYLTEGSGMFGLKNPDDAMRWKGIFNHIVGSARHVNFLAEEFKKLNNEQRHQFFDLGFDINTLIGLDPALLRDFMLINHSARRKVDERKWHELTDDAHPAGESEPLTNDLLRKNGATPKLIELMRSEEHGYLSAVGAGGYLPNLPINILTVADWTFGQKPESLDERFESLRKSQRQPVEVLDILEKSAKYFEKAVAEVIGKDIFDEMLKMKPPAWEIKIREAYCYPSGLLSEQVFQNYRKD